MVLWSTFQVHCYWRCLNRSAKYFLFFFAVHPGRVSAIHQYIWPGYIYNHLSRFPTTSTKLMSFAKSSGIPSYEWYNQDTEKVAKFIKTLPLLLSQLFLIFVLSFIVLVSQSPFTFRGNTFTSGLRLPYHLSNTFSNLLAVIKISALIIIIW